MAQLIFRNNADEQTLHPTLVLGYENEDGKVLEKEIPFKDGDVIQKVANAITQKAWHDIFEIKEVEYINDCWIKGISLTGETGKGRLTVHVLETYVQGSCIVNEEVLQDTNAQKIKEILEIAKREG